MSIKEVLREVDVALEKEEILSIEQESRSFMRELKARLARKKIVADLFVGGSFAKHTMMRKEVNDVDIFLRLLNITPTIIDVLEEVLRAMSNEKGYFLTRMHGSRDYFSVETRADVVFEIVPVKKIARPKEAENVTDLSYFHVHYVSKHLKPTQVREVILAKAFCKAQRVYGAESYIQGFSGYALECLIITYRSFEKMLKAFANAKDAIVLDPMKHYLKPNEIFLEMNESKLKNPIILVDPTWKERNVLAALSEESFLSMRAAAKAFLKRPSLSFFKERTLSIEEVMQKANQKKAQAVEIVFCTDRQAGDIAGTKMKKFYKMLIDVLHADWEVVEHSFWYGGEEKARAIVIARPRKVHIFRGPPVHMIKHAQVFKKTHRKTYVKEGVLFAEATITQTLTLALESYKKEYAKKIAEMDITQIAVKRLA